MVATKATSKNEINDLSCNAFKAVAKNYMTSLKEKNDGGVLEKPKVATNPFFTNLAEIIDKKEFLESIITAKMPNPLGASGNPGAPVPTTAYDFEAQNVIIDEKNKDVKFYENNTKDGYLMSLKVLKADDTASIKLLCFLLSKATSGNLELADIPDAFDAIDRKDYPLEINETDASYKDQFENFKKSDAYITYINYVESVDDSVAAAKAVDIAAEKKAIQDALDTAARAAADAATAEVARAAAEAIRIAALDAADKATAQEEENKNIAEALRLAKEAEEKEKRKREETALKEKEEKALAAQKKLREAAASGDVEAELGVNPKLLNGNNRNTNQKAILQFLTTTKVDDANVDKLKEVIKGFNAKQEKDIYKLNFKNPHFDDTKKITGAQINAILAKQGWVRPKKQDGKTDLDTSEMQLHGLAKLLGYVATSTRPT
jgi:hypothetical protein